MKADQERVKNLLIDTVTLLCKNSLTYDDELCVEGLLGVKVDSKDVFFVHISESFPSALSAQRTAQNIERISNDVPSTPSRKRALAPTDSPASRNSPQIPQESHLSHNVNIKKEAAVSDDECMVMEEPPVLRSPDSVAHQATRIAGQRRVRSPRTPSSQSPNQDNTPYQNDPHGMGYDVAPDSEQSGEYPEFEHVGKLESDSEPPSKRRLATSDSGADGDNGYPVGTQWPNVAAMGEYASQVAHSAFQDSDSQMSGGDLSQPGCSSWPGGGGMQQPSDTSVAYAREEITESLGWENLRSQCLSVTQSQSSILKGSSEVTASGKASSMIRQPRFQVLSHEKPHKCQLCGMSFIEAWLLKRHFITHTGERNHKCVECSATFTLKHNLQRHMKSKH